MKTELIQGAVGRVEILHHVPASVEHELVAVLCHPNPLEAGTMHNKVVTILAKAYEMLGIPTVRFNYRGVGKSEGQYGNIEGEVQDALSVVEWVKKQHSGFKLAMGGFSFGANIAARVACEREVQHLVSVACVISRYDFSYMCDFRKPWLGVIGEADELVNVHEVKEWAKTMPIDMREIPACSHFFHGKLLDLREMLLAWLKETPHALP